MLKRLDIRKHGDGWNLFDQLGNLVDGFKLNVDALGGGTFEKLVGAGTVSNHREDGHF